MSDTCHPQYTKHVNTHVTKGKMKTKIGTRIGRKACIVEFDKLSVNKGNVNEIRN